MSILSVDQIQPIGSGTTITLNATEVKTGTEITVGTGASIFSPAGNTLTLGTNNVERIRIKNDGKIGIGTNNPARHFHLHVDSSIANYQSFTNSTTGATTDDGFLLGISSTEQGIIWNYENTSLRIGTNNTERLTISSDGKVGINITDNTTDLHVRNSVSVGNASFKMGGSSSNTSGLQINYSNSGYTSTIIKQNYRASNAGALMEFDSGYFVFKTGTGGDERLRIGSSGQIGLGGANYGNSGEVLTSQGGSSAPTWATPSGAGAGVNGTQITPNNSTDRYQFTIPTTATRIVIRVFELQGASNSYPYIRVRNSGGEISSGYKNVDGYIYFSNNNTTFYTRTDRFELGTQNWASTAYHWTGFAELNLVHKTGSSNVWYFHKELNEFKSSYWSGNGLFFKGSGMVDCGSNPLTGIDVINSSGNFGSGGLRVDYYY